MKSELQEAFGLFSENEDEQNDVPEKEEICLNTLQLTDPNPGSSFNKLKELHIQPSLPEKSKADLDNGNKLIKLSFWKNNPLLYTGPLEYVSMIDGIGGGRGYLASSDIYPGALILEEKVYLDWPSKILEGEKLLIETIKKILQSSKWEEIMEDMGMMHPVHLDDVPHEILSVASNTFLSQIDEVITEAFLNRMEKAPEANKILQVVLAMQTSAFQGGVFLHTSFFNHSCDPNCIKYTQDSKTEVRAVRPIKKGEQLTISYIHPREMSLHRRNEILWNQFGFLCSCCTCKHSQLESKEFLLLEAKIRESEKLIGTGDCSAATLAFTLDILYDLLEIVPHDHMILMRVHRIVSDCCAFLSKKEPVRFREHSILFLRSSYELLELQKRYLHPDHIDLARTYHDISQGIQTILTSNPSIIYQEFPEWRTFREVSYFENECRMNYLRIKKLYS